jgi:hypothetical protein
MLATPPVERPHEQLETQMRARPCGKQHFPRNSHAGLGKWMHAWQETKTEARAKRAGLNAMRTQE